MQYLMLHVHQLCVAQDVFWMDSQKSVMKKEGENLFKFGGRETVDVCNVMSASMSIG